MYFRCTDLLQGFFNESYCSKRFLLFCFWCLGSGWWRCYILPEIAWSFHLTMCSSYSSLFRAVWFGFLFVSISKPETALCFLRMNCIKRLGKACWKGRLLCSSFTYNFLSFKKTLKPLVSHPTRISLPNPKTSLWMSKGTGAVVSLSCKHYCTE